MKNEIQSKVKSDLDEQQEIFAKPTIKNYSEELGGNVHQEEIENMKKR